MTVWTRGILAALISGAAGGIVNAFSAIGIAPESFNLHAARGFKNVLYLMAISAVCTAILGVAFYFKTSPLPPAPPQMLSGK